MDDRDVVEITSEYDQPTALKALIEQRPGNLELHLQQSKIYRGIDTAIVVAMVSSGASVIASLVNILTGIYAKKSGATIKIHTRDGDQIEFPASSSGKDIEAMLALHERLRVQRVEIIKG